MEARVIGQYRITGVLGEGGMGMVYAAVHTLLGRQAAIKVLLPELSSNQEIVARFFNEARAVTEISHPSIVEIYDYGRMEDGTAFIVMELLKGESLRARTQRMRLRWSTALTLTRQIAGALEAAHARGITHRDLKPDNIFLVRDPEVPGGERIKLLDFGIAKLSDHLPDQRKTRTGMIMGTPTYMAPEQCRGVAIDARADLYALGCILFELCTGRPPFAGGSEFDVLTAHVYAAVPAIASLARDVPREIDLLVQRLLAKSPGDRIQTAAEVVRLVTDMSAGLGRKERAELTGTAASAGWQPVSTTLSGAVTVHHRLPSTMTRRRPVLLRSAGAVAVAAAVTATSLGLAVPGSHTPGAIAPSAPPADIHSTGAPAPLPKRVDEPPPRPAKLLPSRPMEGPTPLPPTKAPPTVLELSIDSTPVGAKVALDGREVGTTPFHGGVPRGNGHEIVVRMEGYRDHSIAVSAAGPIRQHVKLQPLTCPSAPVEDSTPQDEVVDPFSTLTTSKARCAGSASAR